MDVSNSITHAYCLHSSQNFIYLYIYFTFGDLSMSILLFLFWFVLIPTMIGFGLTFLFKLKITNLFLSILIGFISMGALFQVIAVPNIYYHQTLSKVIFLWKISVYFLIALTMIGIVFKIFRKKTSFRLSFLQVQKDHTTLLLSSIIVALVFLQIGVVASCMHLDNDDSRFIASSVIAYETDRMFTLHPVTGEVMENFVDEIYKDVTSPLTIYYALMARLTHIHPAVLAHTIVPILYLLFYYAIAYGIGLFLFPDSGKKAKLFVLLICIFNMLGCVTRYTTSSFLLLRLWQGKSMIANLSLPLIVYCFMRLSENYKDWYYWMILFMNMFFSCLCSGMGIALPLVLVGICSFILMIKHRKLLPLVLGVLCFAPNIAYGLLYYKIMSSVIWLTW